ncbi:MAG: NAD/NADP octopine/nopaline dehydrogenase family protein [Tropicimonas sp.]|uniref:NAD/NADP octopine/nopaline dehydrogenase family protein n=1 Tax=Tropicimonas sp. TaxID=2067044 RepID=UPI003A8649F7
MEHRHPFRAHPRIKRGEDWENYLCITPAVGRLIERLDIERLGLASSFGFKVRDVHEHYLMTFPDIAPGTVSDMAGQVGAGTKGPVTLQNRYITEDLPFGIIPLCELGRRLGTPLPLHEAGVALLTASLGTDFRSRNDILEEVLEELDCQNVSQSSATLPTGPKTSARR